MSRLLGIAAACGLLLAACSSSSSPSSSSSSVASTTTSSAGVTTTTNAVRAELSTIGPAAATGVTISLARGPQGIFVIGPNGHSLYVFDDDKGTTSACTGGCASTWPALTATGTPTVGAVVDKAQVATATGQIADQVTYYGHLLYSFSGDTAPGQTNGIKVTGWHLLGPFGNVMLPRP